MNTPYHSKKFLKSLDQTFKQNWNPNILKPLPETEQTAPLAAQKPKTPRKLSRKVEDSINPGWTRLHLSWMAPPNRRERKSSTLLRPRDALTLYTITATTPSLVSSPTSWQLHGMSNVPEEKNSVGFTQSVIDRRHEPTQASPNCFFVSNTWMICPETRDYSSSDALVVLVVSLFLNLGVMDTRDMLLNLD